MAVWYPLRSTSVSLRPLIGVECKSAAKRGEVLSFRAARITVNRRGNGTPIGVQRGL